MKLKTIFMITLIVAFLPISVFATVASSSTIYEGIDVSNWQGYINYEQVRNSGIDVVYIKSSQGANIIDAYNVYASSGGTKGYCLHGRGNAHTYMIDYASYYGTNYFLLYVDGNNAFPMVNSVYVDSQQIAQISHKTSYFEYIVPRYGAFGINGVFQSDTQLKENINDTKLNAIDIINKIRHIEFDWKDTKMAVGEGHEEIGYSANQIEEDVGLNIVYEVQQPENSEFEKIKQINENRIMPLVTKAIQELSKENKELKEENEKQNKMINFLINKLNCKEEFEEYMRGEK